MSRILESARVQLIRVKKSDSKYTKLSLCKIVNLVEDAVCEGGRALLVRRVEVVPRADVVLVGGREGDLGLAVPRVYKTDLLVKDFLLTVLLVYCQ